MGETNQVLGAPQADEDILTGYNDRKDDEIIEEIADRLRQRDAELARQEAAQAAISRQPQSSGAVQTPAPSGGGVASGAPPPDADVPPNVLPDTGDPNADGQSFILDQVRVPGLGVPLTLRQISNLVSGQKSTLRESSVQVAGGVLEAAQNGVRGFAELNRAFRELDVQLQQKALDLGAEVSGSDLQAQAQPNLQTTANGIGLNMLANLIPQIEKSGETIPDAVRGISRFLVGFVPALRGAKAAGVAGTAARGLSRVPLLGRAAGTRVGREAIEGGVAGAPADFFTSSGDDANLSNLIEGLAPDLKDSTLTFLATDPANTELKNRFLNMVEGIITGGVIDVSLGRALSHVFGESVDAVRRSGVDLEATPEQALAAVDNQIADAGIEDTLASRLASGEVVDIEEARQIVAERIENTNLPEEIKLQMFERSQAMTDLGALGQVDEGLLRVQELDELESAGGDLVADGGSSAPAVSTRQQALDTEVDVLRREPTIEEGAEGIQVSSLRDPATGRLKVPIRSLPAQELELQEFIRQEGGIKLEGEELRGELERLISPRFLRANPRLQNNSSGKTLQEIAEKAAELGFTPTADKTSFLEALDQSRNRRGVFSEQATGGVEVLSNPATRRVYQEVQSVVNDFAGRVNEARRAPEGEPRKRSAVHVEAREAIDSGQFTQADVRALTPGTAINDTDASALVQVMADVGVELQRLAQDFVSDGLRVGSQKGKEFAFMLSTLADLDPRRSGAIAEAGRTLGILNDPLSSSNRFLAQFRPILQDASEETMARIAQRVASLPDLSSVTKYSATVSQLARSGRLADSDESSSILLELWMNGLLSGPQTHAANIISNGLFSAYAIPERFVQTTFETGNIATAGREAFYLTYGMLEGVLDGFRAIGSGAFERFETMGTEGVRSVSRARRSRFEGFLDEDLADTVAGADLSGQKVVFNQGRSAITGENVARKLQSTPVLRAVTKSAGERLAKDIATGESGLGTAIDVLGEMVRLPGRSLGASDDFFKAVNYRMELRAQAYRIAHGDEGLRGEALGGRMAEILADPKEVAKAHDAARDFAFIQTFTNKLGPAGTNAQLLINKAPALRLVVPFLKTPLNLMSQAVRRTPVLQHASAAFRSDLAAGGARAARAKAQMAMGYAGAAGIGAMVVAGKVTGAGPADPGLRRQLESEGWQPYSVRIGDRWVSYQRLDPLFMSFGLIADFAEITANAEEGERLEAIPAAIFLALKNNLLSKSWARGVSDVSRALFPVNPSPDASTEGVERYLRRLTATALVPNFFAQIGRANDGIMRETFGLMDEIKARIPGLSQELKPRLNLWGDPVLLRPGLAVPYVSPIYTTSGETSRAGGVLVDANMPVRLPPKKLNMPGLNERMELTADEHHAYSLFSAGRNRNGDRLRGQPTLQEEIEMIADRPRFQRASKDDQRSAISEAIAKRRRDAKGLLLREFPEFKKRYDEARAEPRTSGSGPNSILKRQLRIESGAAGLGVTVR